MADRLWSYAVRDDWDWRCAVCGTGKCEAHHLVPRQHEAMRYDLMNGIALCAQHHQFDSDVSPHQNAQGWLLWLDEHHPLRRAWYRAVMTNGEHREFSGTKNAEYYCGVIRTLREYVPEDEFERIVGVRFSRYLDNSE